MCPLTDVPEDAGGQGHDNPDQGGLSIVDEHEHPKGALLFMLIYLVVLAGLWLNAYLRLWRD